MSKETSASKYDFRGAQFGGGFAETVQGDQMGTINNYKINYEDIAQLLSTLRQKSYLLPINYKSEAASLIDSLDEDLKEINPDSSKRATWIKRLVSIATAASIATGAAATSTENIDIFLNNSVKLAESLGVAVEEIHHNRVPPSDNS